MSSRIAFGRRTAARTVGLLAFLSLLTPPSVGAAPLPPDVRGLLADSKLCWSVRRPESESASEYEVITGEQLRAAIGANSKVTVGSRGGSTIIRIESSGLEAVWYHWGCPDRAPPAREPTTYIGGSVGGANVDTNVVVDRTGSANLFDPEALNSTDISRSQFTGGFYAGVLGPQISSFLGPVRIGAEVGVNFFSGGDATIPGIPGGPFGTAAGNDAIQARTNWMVTATGVVHIGDASKVLARLLYSSALEQFDMYIKGGVAIVDTTVTFDCRGGVGSFCGVVPTTPAFSDSQHVVTAGPIVGVGVQMPFQLFGLPGTRIGVEYDHVFLPDRDVTLGTLETRLVEGHFSQDIDIVTGRVTVPIDRVFQFNPGR